MTQPSIIMRPSAARERSAPTARSNDTEWAIVGWAGAAFLLVGLADQALVWYPSMFGSAEWEFGSVSSALNALPVPALGAALMVASNVARGRRVMARASSLFLAFLALCVLGALVLYATTLPIALQRVGSTPVRTGLLKAAAKTSLQCVVYPLLFARVAYLGWRSTRESATKV